MSRTTTSVTPSMLEFLKWVAVKRRSYREVMDAWQTSCPRFSVWEDASIAGYVALRETHDDTTVVLTEQGQAVVDAV